VLVSDTSAYINGQRDHYPVGTFPGVWSAVGAAIRDRRIIVPREVYRELMAQDEEAADWIREYEKNVVEPEQEVQELAGLYQREFETQGGARNAADPWVLAEAKHRDFIVVTYEGRSFRGVPTTRWHRSMPGICQHFGIPCRTLPEALGMLGVSL
jgi:hypothetical protein